MMLALNHEQIKKNLQKITRVYPFIDQYEWKDAIFPSHTKGWKNFEKYFVHPHRKKEIRGAYISKKINSISTK